MADLKTKPLRRLVEARRSQIKEIVARHRGLSVQLFGSVATGHEGPDSDIDLLVEFEPGTRPFELLALGAELEDELGVSVDIGTPSSLRDPVRDDVLAAAITL